MENKPYYALTVKAEIDDIIRARYVILRLLKIDQHKVEQESNIVTIHPNREDIRRKLSYVYAEKIEDLEDTYNLSFKMYGLVTPFSILTISKNAAPYATLEKMYSYITTHTDNYYTKSVEETIKNTQKHLKHTFKQLFNDDSVNEAVIDICPTTKTMTIYIKGVGLVYYGTQIGPIRF